MTANTAVAANRERIVILWICLSLFLLRVIGQVEVWLITPAWLPPMEFWYSGLVAYPLLLPMQIVLLMAMAVIVVDETRWNSFRSARRLRALRAVALLYFGSMLLRLIVQLGRGASDALAAGGIPIAFHWCLPCSCTSWVDRSTFRRRCRHTVTARVNAPLLELICNRSWLHTH